MDSYRTRGLTLVVSCAQLQVVAIGIDWSG